MKHCWRVHTSSPYVRDKKQEMDIESEEKGERAYMTRPVLSASQTAKFILDVSAKVVKSNAKSREAKFVKELKRYNDC